MSAKILSRLIFILLKTSSAESGFSLLMANRTLSCSFGTTSSMATAITWLLCAEMAAKEASTAPRSCSSSTVRDVFGRSSRGLGGGRFRELDVGSRFQCNERAAMRSAHCVAWEDISPAPPRPGACSSSHGTRQPGEEDTAHITLHPESEQSLSLTTACGGAVVLRMPTDTRLPLFARLGRGQTKEDSPAASQLRPVENRDAAVRPACHPGEAIR